MDEPVGAALPMVGEMANYMKLDKIKCNPYTQAVKNL